ncbi:MULTISPECIES: glycoside hydrolase family 26 protein [unclassified Frankia]
MRPRLAPRGWGSAGRHTVRAAHPRSLPLPLLLLLIIGLVAGGLSSCSDKPKPPQPQPGGVHWVSGANGNFPADVNLWSVFTGRKVDLAVVFTDRQDWTNLVSAGWPTQAFTRDKFPGGLSVAQPMFPKDGDEATCVTGAYDNYWRQFGTTLTTFGRGDAFVRLGWEFNGDWFWWYPRDVETWKTCYRRTVLAIRSTAPHVRIDWNITAHRDHLPVSGQDVWDAYPGDDYIDVVSIDSYDSYPASVSKTIWDRQCHLRSGLCTVIAFARAHGKKFAVPEWGLVRTTGGGGDNPYYIQKMYETFTANADALAYEAYFNNAEEGNVESSLYRPVLNPNAAERYLALFGVR